MAKIQSTELRLRGVLVSLHEYQILELDRIRDTYGNSRADLIRRAVDLFIKGVHMKENENDPETGSETF